MRYIPIKLKSGQVVDAVPPRNNKVIKKLRVKKNRRKGGLSCLATE